MRFPPRRKGRRASKKEIAAGRARRAAARPARAAAAPAPAPLPPSSSSSAAGAELELLAMAERAAVTPTAFGGLKMTSQLAAYQ